MVTRKEWQKGRRWKRREDGRIYYAGRLINKFLILFPPTAARETEKLSYMSFHVLNI